MGAAERHEVDNLSADEVVLAAHFVADMLAERSVVQLSAKGRLDRSPKKNWVENTGRLPKYVEDIALALERKGMPLQRAIPTAISRIKVWAAGGDKVNPDTVAKAQKALAQWTALKAKNKARMAKKAALSGDFDVERVELSGNVIRRVRSAEGAKRYGQPVGSVIVSDGSGKVLKVLSKGDGTLNGPSAESFKDDPQVAKYGSAKKGEFKNAMQVVAPDGAKTKKSAKAKTPPQAPPADSVSQGEKSAKPAAPKNPTPTTSTEPRSARPSYRDIKPGEYQESSFTPEDVEKRAAEIGARLDQVLAVGDTRTRYSAPAEIDGTRVYTPERKALHRQILSEMLARADADGVGRDGQAYISGGLPGAGKSFVLKNRLGLDTSKYVTLNPDDFKEAIASRTTVPGTEDGAFSPMEMAAVLHEESSDLNKAAIDLFTSLGYNVILDVTLGGAGDKARTKHRATVEKLQSRGYSVDGVFVDIPHEMSRDSAGGRYLRGFADWLNGSSEMGGRYVPANVASGDISTMGFNSSNRDNFESLKDLLRKFSVVDNSVRDSGASLRMLESGGTGVDTAEDPFSSTQFDPLADPIKRLEDILKSLRLR